MANEAADTTTYTIKFNAPAMAQADVVYVPGVDTYGSAAADQAAHLGDGELVRAQRSTVLTRKGWLAPDTTYLSDWTNEDTEEPQTDTSSGGLDLSFLSEALGSPTVLSGGMYQAKPKTEDTSPPVSVNNLFPDKTKYGFRFMYNPTTLSFGLGMASGMNPAYMMSGAATAVPALPTSGSTISMVIPINRVEDVAILQKYTRSEAWNIIRREKANEGPTSFAAWYNSEVGRVMDIPGVDSAQTSLKSVRVSDVDAIATRGTMYDMEYLFRCMLGREWKTYYRGYTADVGMGFSVPLVLFLSPTMVYRVNLAGCSYEHIMFTPDMVPTFTWLNLTLNRIPDVVSLPGVEGTTAGGVVDPPGSDTGQGGFVKGYSGGLGTW